MTDNDSPVDTESLSDCAAAFAADRVEAASAGDAVPVPDPAALAEARERAADLGVDAVPDSVGTVLAMFARMVDARTAVEIGTGAGISALWTLSGMRDDGALTTIDIEPEHQRTARTVLSRNGSGSPRTRLIGGRGLEVLPRLADESYDLMFVDCGGADHARYVAEAVRLLRPGGVLAVHGMLAGAAPWDHTRRDPASSDAREALRAAAEHRLLLPSVLPVGAGLVCAARV